MQPVRADCRLRPQGGREAREGGGGEGRNECVRADAGWRPRGRHVSVQTRVVPVPARTRYVRADAPQRPR
jgi:hypothetical protein